MEHIKINNWKNEYEVISFLRFPLTVLVIFIHAWGKGMIINGEYLDFGLLNYPVFNNIAYIFSEILGRISVPTFFMISGFLLFRNGCTMSIDWWKPTLVRKAKSLLIPYIVWNIIVILLYLLSQIAMPSLMSGSNKAVLDYSVSDWINSFWGLHGGYPACTQLWFVRDLIVVTLLSPILYYIAKNKYFLILTGIIWILGIKTNIVGFDIRAIFFFSLGAYFSLRNKTFILESKNGYIVLIMWLLAIIIEDIHYNTDFLGDINIRAIWALSNTRILTGVFSIVFLSNLLLKNTSIKSSHFLDRSNFFLYAYHEMPLAYIWKILVVILIPSSSFSLLFIYFSSVLLTVLSGLLLFLILERFAPSFLSILTGARSKKNL